MELVAATPPSQSPLVPPPNTTTPPRQNMTIGQITSGYEVRLPYWAPPVGDGVTVPAGIGTLDDLARAARCDKAAILAANAAALGGADRVLARMVLPGCREHRVVAYREGPDPAVEGIDEIARQHGLASRTNLLRDANPQVTSIPLSDDALGGRSVRAATHNPRHTVGGGSGSIPMASEETAT
jgi:hypothetical protein